MNLSLDEQKLIGNFRSMNSHGQQELLQFAALLLKKDEVRHEHNADTSGSQCTLEKRAEKRPETATEPLFTE